MALISLSARLDPFLFLLFAPHSCHSSRPFLIATTKLQAVHNCPVREDENTSKKGGNMCRHSVSQRKKEEGVSLTQQTNLPPSLSWSLFSISLLV